MTEGKTFRRPFSIIQEPDEGLEEVDENGSPTERRLMIKTAGSEIIESRSGFEVMEQSLQSPAGHHTGSYPCVYDGTNGHLRLGPQGVEFVGRMRFIERRVEIKWANVLEIVPGTVGHESCISFLMRTSDQDYNFYNIANHERVWARLVSLHNDFLPDEPAPLMTPLCASLHRMSSAPNINNGRSENTPARLGAAYLAAADMLDPDNKYPTAASFLPRRQALIGSSQTHAEDGVEITGELEEAWKQLQQASGEGSYATSAIQDLILPCNLQNFFHSFIADAASHPLQEFMESSGETNVIVSLWKPAGKDIFARTIGFSHPVNAPLAPPMARARKEQRYWLFEKYGLYLETDTYVEDVPMADCFSVRERILVEPMDEGKKVVVVAEFDIRFTKSTMFRSIIANATRSECLKDIQGLAVYWTEAIGTPDTPEEPVARRRSSIAEWCRASMSDASTLRKSTHLKTLPVEAPEKAPVSPVFICSPAVMLTLGLVLLMQSWILHEVKGMRSTMLELQTSVITLQSKDMCL